MKKSIKLLGLISALLGVSGCSTMELPPTYSIYGVMKTAAFSDDGTVKTAKRGDILLTQTVTAVDAVEFTEDVNYTAGKMLGKMTFDLQKGHKLYSMMSPSKSGLHYCSFDTTVKVGGKLHIGGLDPVNRACFTDSNKDAKFDGFFVLPSKETSFFGGGTMGEPAPIETHIPYQKISRHNAPTGKIGLWYAPNGRMFVVSVEGNKKEVIDEGETKVWKIEDFPKTVEMSGMRIEILSVDKKNVMTYKIINAMPKDFTITQRTTVRYY